jgi:glycerol kinase
MSVNSLLMQFQSDLLQMPVQRPAVSETTALGAAYAAGLTVGYWDDVDALRENQVIAGSWEPRMQVPQRDALLAQWRKAVDRSLGWID